MEKDRISKDRDSLEYEIGVEKFLIYAEQNCENRKKIPCPCSKCVNFKKFPVKIIRGHAWFSSRSTWKKNLSAAFLFYSNKSRKKKSVEITLIDEAAIWTFIEYQKLCIYGRLKNIWYEVSWLPYTPSTAPPSSNSFCTPEKC